MRSHSLLTKKWIQHLAILGMSSLLCIFTANVIHADITAFKEYHIKARYINGFTAFIKWPDEAFKEHDGFMYLCVLGDNPFDEALDVLVQAYNKHVEKHVHQQEVVYLQRGDDIDACHLLYITDSEESYVYQVLMQVKGKPVLTVSSIDDFTDSGGMIQFHIKKSRVRFWVNPKTLRDEKLIPGANLLQVADLVE